MPKPRVIDPRFFDDLNIAALTRDERLLVVAMVVACADDYGRLVAAPAYLRKQAFGYDEEVSIERVGEMREHIFEKCKNIRLYQVDGQEYIRLCNWENYQKIRYKVPSQLPPSPWEPCESDEELSENSRESDDTLASNSPRAGQGRVEQSRAELGRAEQGAAPLRTEDGAPGASSAPAELLAASSPVFPDSVTPSGPDPPLQDPTRDLPRNMRGGRRQRMVGLWEEYTGKPISDQDLETLASWCTKYGTSEVWKVEQRGIANRVNNLGGWMRITLEERAKERARTRLARPP